MPDEEVHDTPLDASSSTLDYRAAPGEAASPPLGPPTVPSWPPPGYEPPRHPAYATAGVVSGATPTLTGPAPAPASPPGFFGAAPVPPGHYHPPATSELSPGEGARPAPRRRRNVALVVALIVIVGLLGAGGAAVLTGSSGNSASAATLVSEALHSASGAGSFHYVSVSNSAGTKQSTLGDAGVDNGTQVITTGRQRFTVLVVGTSCYFKGNAVAMEDELDMSVSISTAHSEQWISLAPSDEPYTAVYAAVTASSALADNVAFKAQHNLGDETVRGRAVIGVSGAMKSLPSLGENNVKGTATLYVTQSTPHFPVAYDERGSISGQKFNSTMTFSQWREHVVANTPSGSVTYTSLGGATGGSGTTDPSSPGPTVLA